MHAGYEIVCMDCFDLYGPEDGETITLGALFPHGIEYCAICKRPLTRTSPWTWMAHYHIVKLKAERYSDA